MVSYTATFSASADVLTYAEAKEHLRLTHDYEQDLVQSYIDVAVISAENYVGRYLHTYNIVCKTGTFTQWLVLQSTPLIDETAVIIKYYDANNALQTLDASWYSILHSNNEPQIYFDESKTYPSLYDRADAVVITYQSGYTTVPTPFKQYCKLVVAFLYENRTDSVDKLPRFTNTLIRPYKKWQ